MRNERREERSESRELDFRDSTYAKASLKTQGTAA